MTSSRGEGIRPRAAASWQAAAHTSREWIGRVRPILEQFTISTPGSQIEEKSASIAWHYGTVFVTGEPEEPHCGPPSELVLV